jgi:hypothetical protein
MQQEFQNNEEAPLKMIPRHVMYQAPGTVEEFVKQVHADTGSEVVLATSGTFYDADEEEFELSGNESDDYLQLFLEAVGELTKLLGEPKYFGSWGSAEFSSRRSIVSDNLPVDRLAIWQSEGKSLYLRFGQLDRELEIEVCLGIGQ